jgi:hypothetical protein
VKRDWRWEKTKAALEKCGKINMGGEIVFF